jgi:hypothetical protein
MRGITSINEIRRHEANEVHRVIGILLTTGYDKSFKDWLFSAWKDIDKDSGENWDILVPLSRMLNEEPIELGTDLCELILDWYGLTKRDAPCIVFDNFDNTKNQVVVKLADADETERKAVLLDVSDFMKQKIEEDRQKKRIKQYYNDVGFSAREWRTQAIDELYAKVKQEERRRFLWRLAPKAFSIFVGAAVKVALHAPLATP